MNRTINTSHAFVAATIASEVHSYEPLINDGLLESDNARIGAQGYYVFWMSDFTWKTDNRGLPVAIFPTLDGEFGTTVIELDDLGEMTISHKLFATKLEALLVGMEHMVYMADLDNQLTWEAIFPRDGAQS